MEQHIDLFNFADDDADELDKQERSDFFAQAVLYGTDWTVKTILQQIQDGNIDLSPDFQRRDAWSSKNKNRFIESVALQIPIPQIVLAEKKDQRGSYIVLDGKQRLLTLAQFAADLEPSHPVLALSKEAPPLRLSGLKILDQLNGKSYSDMNNSDEFLRIKRQFDNHTIRSALIRNWPNEDYLYEVFIRLNTGSAKLSPQELRQAMKPGEFTQFLSVRSSQSSIIQSILNIDGPDFRMRDVDILLRMIAYSYRFLEYRGNLKEFLDNTHDNLNSNWSTHESTISHLVDAIEDALRFLSDNLGSPVKVGRRVKSGELETAVNRALLDVQLACVLSPVNRKIFVDNNLKIADVTYELCMNNAEFVEAIASTTKSLDAVRKRYAIWKRSVEARVGKIEMVGSL
ncbi:DUF262 domain-containing protein [Rhodoferax sp. U11-2br]|uniref:DUF262 domain-containing protein n=1 Tax=Rhodoferax sp. U11-2br TaxID=2838878 RepID=UPI001BE5E910|nr:DUF262 domain-containing protein [Rhodoferax sp. U11-2br]MBT3066575.1 DUF262 domain-containing protein [Rhodoferax sp. U11-2br]